MMSYAPNFIWRRKNLIQVPPPTGRIIAIAKAVHPGPIQDAFNPTTQTGGGLSLGHPQGFSLRNWLLQNLLNQSRIDPIDLNISNFGESISSERTDPLLPVLCILPACLLRGNIC